MNTISQGSHRRLVLARKFRAWAVWQVVVPVLVIFVCWPLAYFFLQTSYAFYRNFVSGDLLLIGALLFVGIAIEIHTQEKDGNPYLERVDPSDRLDCLYHQSQILSFFFAAFFWWIKIKSVSLDFPIQLPGTQIMAPLSWDIQFAAWASVSGGVLAIIWAYRAALKVHCISVDAEILQLNTEVNALKAKTA
jgi:hypothetical protein